MLESSSQQYVQLIFFGIILLKNYHGTLQAAQMSQIIHYCRTHTQKTSQVLQSFYSIVHMQISKDAEKVSYERRR